MRIFKVLLSVILLFAVSPVNLLAQKSKDSEMLFPSSSPEQQGISSAILDSMMLFIKNTNQNIHHLTIIRNNYTVLNADIYPYSSNYFHDLASVTKSITSLLIGIAIDQGFIKDEYENVIKFFPEIRINNKILNTLKIKDLLTMTSGFPCDISGDEKILTDMRKSEDWVKFIFNLPLTTKPGETFSYCSCNFYLLAEIIYRASKLTPHEFAKKYLFAPLNITNSKWLANYKNINHGWGDLFLLPADMAKIGKLVLEKGKWQDKQVVSAQWIDKCLRTFSRLPDDKGYGYGWWTNDKVGYYEAAGRGRQTISVIPSKNMIVTMLGGEFDAGTIGKYIFRSIQSDNALAENENDFEILDSAVKEAALMPSHESLFINDSITQRLNDRTITFQKNIAGIDSMRFSFSSKTNGTVLFYKNHMMEKYPFVLSTNKYAICIDSTVQLPVALQAGFMKENEFVLHYNQLCRINNFYFYFIINDEKISTTMEEKSNFFKLNLTSSFQ